MFLKKNKKKNSKRLNMEMRVKDMNGWRKEKKSKQQNYIKKYDKTTFKK